MYLGGSGVVGVGPVLRGFWCSRCRACTYGFWCSRCRACT